MPGISPAVLGAVVVINGMNNDDPEVTCKLVVPEGLSSDGLECIVRPIEHLSDSQVLAVTLGFALLAVLIVGSMIWYDKLQDRKFYERNNMVKDKKRKGFRK